MRFLRSSTLWQTAAFAIVALIVVAALGWIPRADVSQSFLDIESGRTRETYHFLWIPFVDHVESTPVSEVLAGESGAAEDWIGTSWRDGKGIGCGFGGGVAGQTRTFEALWEAHRFTPEARRESARRLRETWKASKALRREQPTRDYVKALWDALHAPDWDGSRVVTVDDLPSIRGVKTEPAKLPSRGEPCD